MEEYKIGSIISFGSYKWRVLDMQNNKALLVTENAIERRPYHDAYKEITWADCALRKYLNGEFYDRFTAVDKSRIIPVLNKNPDNPWYGSKGGADTKDSIFLLSLEEVCRYFGDSTSKLYNPGKNQRYWFERKDENNSKRLAIFEGTNKCCWWWLRSPGRVNVKAVYIFGTDGNIGIQGNNILKGNIGEGECKGAVRPALWLTLEV